MEKIIWWIIKKLIFMVDRDDTLLVHSFGKDEVTDYHIVAERSYPDRHCYGVSEEKY